MENSEFQPFEQLYSQESVVHFLDLISSFPRIVRENIIQYSLISAFVGGALIGTLIPDYTSSDLGKASAKMGISVEVIKGDARVKAGNDLSKDDAFQGSKGSVLKGKKLPHAITPGGIQEF